MSSSVAFGAPAGGSSGKPRGVSAPRPPPPPRNCTRCAMISVMYRRLPSLSSYWRVRMEPSMYTWRPLARYWPHDSPCLPHTTTFCHSVRSWRCPSWSFHTSLVAIGKRATARPVPVKRTSGSFQRFPISITRFTDIAASSRVGTIIAGEGASQRRSCDCWSTMCCRQPRRQCGRTNRRGVIAADAFIRMLTEPQVGRRGRRRGSARATRRDRSAPLPRVDLCVCAPVCSPGLRQLRFAAVGERRAVILVSILKLILVGLNTIVVASIAGVVALFDERAAYRVCQLWVRINLLVGGVRVRTRRLATLDPKMPYVFMSNHRSQFDVLAVIVALPEFQLRWVAKVELTRVPVFGWALRRSGHIIIDRSDTT